MSTKNPYVIQSTGKSITGRSYTVLDTRTGEVLGANLSKRLASEIAAEEWAIEKGEE